MVSMLGPGQPVVDSDDDDRPFQTDWALKDVGAWTKLVVCVGLGIALGAVNLAAVGAPGMLRIPAFLAALILCAQGPVDLGEYQREKEGTQAAEKQALKEWEERQEARQARLSVISNENVQPLRERLAAQAVAEAAESKTEAETRLLNEQVQKQEAAARIRAGAVAESRTGLVIVAILAIWLGLATLNYPQSPPLLLWLSLVASFLLFVSVWGGLQSRPAGS
jgi:cytochrome c-type biogenesis protein CcmH/NrfG